MFEPRFLKFKCIFINFFLIFVFFIIPKTSFLQGNSSSTSSIFSNLKGLNELGRVLYIGATPSDKDVDLLNYFSKEKYYRTGFLSLTRGEKQKNKYSFQGGMELGLIHVQEGIESQKLDEIENFYTRAVDQGETRSDSEVLANWDKSKILSDVVWVIRNFQPDVIITKYSPEGKSTGQAIATAIISQEAFKIAGDSNYLPEQFTYGVKQWQAKRLFSNENTSRKSESHFQILQLNTFNAVTGYNVADLSALSRSVQRTTFQDFTPIEGTVIDSLFYLAGDSLFVDLMDGIDNTWRRLGSFNEAAELTKLINNMVNEYNFEAPFKSVDPLIKAYKLLLNTSFTNLWKSEKLNMIKSLLIQCAGVVCNVYSTQNYAVPGDSLEINFLVIKKSNLKVVLKRIRIGSIDTLLHGTLISNRHYAFKTKTLIEPNRPVTQPHWLRKPMDNEYSYNIDDQLLIGRSKDFSEYTGQIVLSIDSTDVSFNYPVQSEKPSIIKPFTSRLTTILPIIVDLTPSIILTNVKPGNTNTRNQSLFIKYKSNFTKDSVQVRIKLLQLGIKTLKAGVTLESTSSHQLYQTDTTLNLSGGAVYSFNIPIKNLQINYKGTLMPIIGVEIITSIDSSQKRYSSSLYDLKYEYLPNMSYYYRKYTKIIPDEIKVNSDSIGYIYATDDAAFPALKQLGFTVKYMDINDFSEDSIRKLNSIFVGRNISNIESYLGAEKYDVLMKYVFEGGGLIFLDEKNPISIERPFRLQSILDPVQSYKSTISINSGGYNSILNAPNKIQPAELLIKDENITEYSFVLNDSMFAKPITVSSQKRSMTSQRNYFVIKKYGAGSFIFSGISLNQKLLAGTVSSYKFLANIISLRK